MIKEERFSKIIQYVNENQYAGIDVLMEIVHASKSTIRRDLIDLSNEGKLRFVRGGASSVNSIIKRESLYEEKATDNTDEKDRIGKAAASLLNENDIVFVGPGTTTRSMVKYIDHTMSLRVMTNDIMIATELAKMENIELSMTGGQLRKNYYTLIGYGAEAGMENIRIEKCFLSCDAVDFQKGFFIANQDEVGINRKIMNSSTQISILADHSKWNKKSYISYCDFSDIDIFITDTQLKKENIKRIEKLGVNVIVADK